MPDPLFCTADPAALREARRRLDEALGIVRDADAVLRRADDLGWAGTAADAYRRSLDEAHARVVALPPLLDHAHDALRRHAMVVSG